MRSKSLLAPFCPRQKNKAHHLVSLWLRRWDLFEWWRKLSANTTMGYLPLGIVLLSDWSVCARCGLVAPSWQYTATGGGMDPTPLSELMNNCKLECEQGWWKVQSATRSVHIERSSWGLKPISTQATKEKNSVTRMGNWISLVAEMGFEKTKRLSAILRSDTQNYAVCRHCSVGHRPRLLWRFVLCATAARICTFKRMVVYASFSPQNRFKGLKVIRLKPHLAPFLPR